MLMDKPIVVSTKPLQLSGTVRGPIVVTPQEGDSGDTTPRLGYNQPTYKVKLVANGKTFNMLLPPSIESKHPGRSNPLQLPGLQIKANINISKLKIPGFFPIYQNLGVESLTISMSGMFTGYDGTNLLSAANWENSVGIGQSNVEQGQDSFTSASELYDFAVNNKALVQVTIYTSDGSFIPKQSTSTAFRDSSSNISFKGYIKEFEQVYIRQDRNYYLLRFEIVDFGNSNSNNKCKTVVKSDKTNNTLLNKITGASIGLGRNLDVITKEDKIYISKEQIAIADEIIQMIADKKPLKDITDKLENIGSFSLGTKLALYAEANNYNMTTYLTKESITRLQNLRLPKSLEIKNDSDLYLTEQFLYYANILCKRNLSSCSDYENFYKQKAISAINAYTNGNDPNESNPPIITEINIDPNEINPPIRYKEPSNIDSRQVIPFYKQVDAVLKNYPGLFKNDLSGGIVFEPKGNVLGSNLMKEDLSLFDPNKDAYEYVGNNNLGEPLINVYKGVIITINGKRNYQIGASYHSSSVLVIKKTTNNNTNTKYELQQFRVVE